MVAGGFGPCHCMCHGGNQTKRTGTIHSPWAMPPLEYNKSTRGGEWCISEGKTFPTICRTSCWHDPVQKCLLLPLCLYLAPWRFCCIVITDHCGCIFQVVLLISLATSLSLVQSLQALQHRCCERNLLSLATLLSQEQ